MYKFFMRNHALNLKMRFLKISLQNLDKSILISCLKAVSFKNLYTA